MPLLYVTSALVIKHLDSRFLNMFTDKGTTKILYQPSENLIHGSVVIFINGSSKGVAMLLRYVTKNSGLYLDSTPRIQLGTNDRNWMAVSHKSGFTGKSDSLSVPLQGMKPLIGVISS